MVHCHCAVGLRARSGSEQNPPDHLLDGGTLAGDGLIQVFGTQFSKLVNSGTIRAEGGVLTIRSVVGGTFDLDGFGATLGTLEAIDGAATLVIDGDISDDFSSTMNIGAGNTIQFDQAWATDFGSTINFDAAGGIGTLQGATLTLGGTMNVNSGTARIDAPLDFENTSTTNVAAGATLNFGLNLNDINRGSNS